MKYVLLIYQGPTPPLPGNDRWQTLSEAEQKAIYADYQEVTKAPGVTPGLPLGLPNAARTVQVAPEAPSDSSPEDDLALAEATGPALLVVLEALAPGERVAFVLHDMFDLSFEEIARILGSTPTAARQLASRARRRVRGTEAPPADVSQHRELVGAFLAASRDGDFERLVAVLSPEVVLRADQAALRAAAAGQGRGAPELAAEVRGAARVANAFKGRARGASPALINGEPGAVWAIGGRVLTAFVFTIERDKITGIDVVMEPAHLAGLELKID